MKNAIFKVLLLLALSLSLVISLASCDVLESLMPPTKEPDCVHVDADDDLACDICSAEFDDGEEKKDPDGKDDPIGASCEHESTTWIVETQPTCSSAGVNANVCLKCGETVDRESVDAIAHTQGEWVTYIQPTCATVGRESCSCSVCGAAIEQRDIPKLTEHTPGSAVIENSSASSCTVGGTYDEVVYCSVSGCGAELSRVEKVLETSAHTPSGWITATEATCVSEGREYKQCLICRTELESRVIPVSPYHTGDNGSIENYVRETCSTLGYYDYVIRCSVPGCGVEMSREVKYVEMSPHDPKPWQITTPATCAVEGLKEQKCYGCGATLDSEIIPKLTVHTPGSVTTENYIDSTCTALGSYEQVTYCMVGGCGIEIARIEKTVPMKDHVSGDWINDSDPTCQAAGSRHKVCTVCGNTTVTESISKVTHVGGDPQYLPEIEPTCVSGGSYYDVCYCIWCGVETSRERFLLDKTEHSYVDAFCTVCYVDERGSKGLEYVSNGDGTCYLKSRGNCTDSYIIIPTRAEGGEYVTAIGNDAFENDSLITGLEIPDGVTRLGSDTFAYCTNLITLVLPGSIEFVSASAFNGSTGVVEVEGGIKYLKDWAIFADIDITSATVREGTRGIASRAFYGRKKLTTISLPSSLSIICDFAFDGCSLLQGVSIPEGVKVIPYSAFVNCTALASLELSEGLVEIGKDAFKFCYALEGVSFPDTLEVIGEGAFGACTKLTTVDIPDGVTAIKSGAFSGCDAVTTFTIGSGVREIGNGALSGRGVVSYTVSESNENYKNIGAHLYTKDGTTLVKYAAASPETEFAVPAHVVYVGYGAFLGSNNLTYVTISGISTKYIGEFAFNGCKSLVEVVIGDGVEKIYGDAFNGCKALKYVTIGSGIRYIGGSCFLGTALTSVTFTWIPNVINCINQYTPSVTKVVNENDLRTPAGAAKALKTTYVQYIWQMF